MFRLLELKKQSDRPIGKVDLIDLQVRGLDVEGNPSTPGTVIIRKSSGGQESGWNMHAVHRLPKQIHITG